MWKDNNGEHMSGKNKRVVQLKNMNGYDGPEIERMNGGGMKYVGGTLWRLWGIQLITHSELSTNQILG